MSAVPDFRLLAELRDAGLSVERADAGRVRVAPGERLSPELRNRIVARKPELLAAMNLAHRIGRMAARWRYTDAELSEALLDAEANPSAWIMCVSRDEEMAERLERAELLFLA